MSTKVTAARIYEYGEPDVFRFETMDVPDPVGHEVQLADYSALEGRLAPSADAGFMSTELVAGWVGAAKGLYDHKPQMQRDEAIRSATFGAGSLLYAAEVHGFGSCPMIGFDAV